MPRKATPPVPPRARQGSVLDAIDALEAKRKRTKPSGLFPKPKPEPTGDLDLGSIR